MRKRERKRASLKRERESINSIAYSGFKRFRVCMLTVTVLSVRACVHVCVCGSQVQLTGKIAS